jgi:trk system potassium uptake protein TrkA
MYVVIAGAGKVGENLTRTLIRRGHEVTLIETRRDRVQRLEEEFDYRIHLGDATEVYVLERAGIERPPDLVLAVTGDDEDNIVICQLAREKYGVPKVIARVNDPRNQAHFDLLGIVPTVCATSDIMSKIEHEVPGMADLIHLLDLQQENLEIIEVEIDNGSPAAGKTVESLDLPADSRLILVSHNGQAGIAIGSTRLEVGDRVMAILQTGKEDEVRNVLLSSKSG